MVNNMRISKAQLAALAQIKTISYDWVNRELVESEVTARDSVFVREDGTLVLSGEDGRGFADYYCEFGVDIHPELVEWAESMGCYWEWENPGCAVLAN